MNAIYSILSISLMTAQGPPFWTPSVLKDREVYSSVVGTTDNIVCYRLSDNIRIHVMVGRPTTDGGLDQAMAVVPDSERSVSGLEIGSHFRLNRSKRTYTVAARTRWDVALVGIQTPVVRTGKFRSLTPRDLSVEDAFIERLLRETLARFASRRLQPDGTIRINGVAIPRWKAPEQTSMYYVDIMKWGAAHGIAINRNDAMCRFAYLKDGRQFLYHWGSSTLYWGQSKTSFGSGIVMVKGSTIYVPVDGLEL